MHSAATIIQTAARVYLARRERDRLYVEHIQSEIALLGLARKRAKRQAKKRRFLDQKATLLQKMVRGHLVRNVKQKYDSTRRDKNDGHDSWKDTLRNQPSRNIFHPPRMLDALKLQVPSLRQDASGETESENDSLSDTETQHPRRQPQHEISSLEPDANVNEMGKPKPLLERVVKLRNQHRQRLRRFVKNIGGISGGKGRVKKENNASSSSSNNGNRSTVERTLVRKKIQPSSRKQSLPQPLEKQRSNLRTWHQNFQKNLEADKRAFEDLRDQHQERLEDLVRRIEAKFQFSRQQ